MTFFLFTVKCPKCDYHYTDIHEWMVKLKCGAHKKYSKHFSYIQKEEIIDKTEGEEQEEEAK